MHKSTLKYWLGLSIVCYLVLNFISKDALGSISNAVTVTFGLYVFYDVLLWRINPFEKTPRLKKKYRAETISCYNGGTTLSSEITIIQTLSTLKITEIWSKNRAHSVNATMQNDEQGNWILYYTYSTRPDPFHAAETNDQMHFGTCMLNIDSNKDISGEYFTNRKPTPTFGTIKWVPLKKTTKVIYNRMFGL